MLEQQPFGNGSRRRHALGRGAGKAMARKTALGGAQYQLSPQITCHAEGTHLVSKHSPLWRSQGILLRRKIPVAVVVVIRPVGVAWTRSDRAEPQRAANPVHDERAIP